MQGDIKEVLSRIKPEHLVLDVGGWASPFNRANWILDSQPYATRGFYKTIGLPAFQGGEVEHFTAETWVQRDICSKEPWPFADKSFDFSICSHTLEDIRDPLYVCSELIRVSKRGYIEVPSRLIESCRGAENENIAGLSHHRWLVEISGDHVQFTMKYHGIHADFSLSLPPSFAKQISTNDSIAFLFWEDSFTFSETQLNGLDEIYKNLRAFVSDRYQYPLYQRGIHWINKQAHRGLRAASRRLGR